jgi:hypothetical protein
VLDLTKQQSVLNPTGKKNVKRWRIDAWKNADIPVHLMDGLNHGTILTDPGDEIVDLVQKALDVDDTKSFNAWLKGADARGRIERSTKGHWQQFVVRACDERGDPITDYNLPLYIDKDDPSTRVEEFDKNVEVYSKDESFRCFLIDLDKVTLSKSLWLSACWPCRGRNTFSMKASRWSRTQNEGLSRPAEGQTRGSTSRA